MRKTLFTFFVPILPILLFVFFFACDYNFKWPKEIEITKETPELSFDANIDEFNFSDLFGDLDKFDVGTGDARLLVCNDTSVLTYVIYIELYNGDIGDNLPEYFEYFAGIGVPEFETEEDDEKLLWAEAPFNVDPPTLTDTPLENFSLKPLTSRAYISGANPNIVDILYVELMTGADTHIFGRSQPSNIPEDATEYSGTSLPPSVNEFEVSFDEELIVNFNVYLKGGQTVQTEWLDDLDVKLELAVWFACEFITGPGGAEIELPFSDMFIDEGGDLFGRESADDESFLEMVENITLEIQFSANPFPDAKFVVESPGTTNPLESLITQRTLSMSIDKEDLNYIFYPSFSVKFEEGNEIIVPRVFNLEKLGFKAKLKYVIKMPNIGIPGPWQ